MIYEKVVRLSIGNLKRTQQIQKRRFNVKWSIHKGEKLKASRLQNTEKILRDAQ